MPLVSSKEMVNDAYRNHYAIGAFPAHNLEMIRAVTEAADDLSVPIILQSTPATIYYMGMDHMVSMVKTAADGVSVPVSLHLDHGESIRTVHQCVRGGYNSIMIDGSLLPFEENIDLVKQVVSVCHDVDVPVEAELGAIGKADDESQDMEYYTDPSMAEEFVYRTKIDFLAAAFGTAHGQYKKAPRLDFDRVKKISEQTGVPIVMHGASGVPDEDLKRAIGCGVSKVNFSTELKQAFFKELSHFLHENPLQNDPRKVFVTSREAVKSIVKEKLLLLKPIPKAVQ
ncbi:class II fructose-bisphosphate aldolase [Fictibacillus sp. KU28468]|uniref:class II fructose-bisphosphate aldolase n=1 Tax=Fictibacillus sp. KU28468 TaxID=2991053 RepID=UPI00223CEFDA|nr:class II fructose-bisphosphate aldolase [Fictibacillus sp. KU28468]UZJ80951.1 class II fructose-bisphosphate aldolase [Fictibacillus sp. KU28468]